MLFKNCSISFSSNTACNSEAKLLAAYVWGTNTNWAWRLHFKWIVRIFWKTKPAAPSTLCPNWKQYCQHLRYKRQSFTYTWLTYNPLLLVYLMHTWCSNGNWYGNPKFMQTNGWNHAAYKNLLVKNCYFTIRVSWMHF